MTLLGVGCYLGVVAVTGLLLAAAVTNERETATDEIRRREEQLRLSLDAARMGVWFWSAKDNTLTWDDTLRQMYGLGPDDRVSGYEDFIARVHPDDREFVESSVRRALADGGRLDYEFRILLPDGRVRWVADLGRVIPGKDGAAAGMTGTCQDVTDRRTAEEQLRLAHKMESVGRLAGGVAHETNNQMSVVMSAADFILARADLPSAVRADAEYIRRAAERTAAVTAQLLAFSRRQVLRTRVLDLNAVLEGFRPVLQRTLGEDCQVTLLLDPALGRVRADPGQLEQVLLNLTINARDAMPRGGTLSVETSTALLTERSAVMSHGLAVAPGRYALMSVSDTGNGMDKATLAQIFEPFFTTKAVGEGTGLGLATVYGIVKQSGGYVWAYSEPGRGTDYQGLPAAHRRTRRARGRSGPGPAGSDRRADPARRGRGAGAGDCRARAGRGGIPGAGGGPRPAGARRPAPERRAARARARRRGDAGAQRFRAGGRAGASRSWRAGAVHVGIYRLGDPPARAARGGGAVPRQAVLSGGAGEGSADVGGHRVRS